jgi:hypothetical protein
MWHVEPDPHPAARGHPEEAIQVFSEFWHVAYHCLIHLDFYLWDRVTGTFAFPGRLGDVIEAELHGRLPHFVYTREELLDYAVYCRGRAREVLEACTGAQLRGRIPTSPWAGITYRKLLQKNLAHVLEHTEDLRRFLGSRPPLDGRPATVGA